MSPLEAMARAMFESDTEGFATFDNCGDWIRNGYLDSARAALIALRDCTPSDAVFDAMVEGRWRAMLDAALEEG